MFSYVTTNLVNLEATPGFEPEIGALQARALPLGHAALNLICGGARDRT